MGWFSGHCFACDGFMFIIQRIALILLLAIPAFLPNTAFADYAATIIFWKLYPAHEQTSKFTTSQLTCSHDISLHSATDAPYTLQNDGDGNCVFTDKYGQSRNHAPSKYKTCNGVDLVWSASPGNGLCSGSAPPPTCAAGTHLDTSTNTCVPDCVAGCNGACGSPYQVYSVTWPDTFCIDGCRYNLGEGIGLADNMWYYDVKENTGQTCTTGSPAPAPKPPENTPEYDCLKDGKSYGTVNGVVVCTTLGSTGSAPAATTGSSSSTDSSTTTNSDGSTSTSDSTTQTDTKTQYNSDGTVKTSTNETTTNGDGTSTTQTSEGTYDKEDYCALNPTSSACAEQTDCQENPEGPTCKHFCVKFPDSLACADIKTLKEEINGLPADGGWLKKEFNLTFTKTVLPESVGCPAPITISLGFTSVSIPYDWLCQYAEAFRSVVIAFAYIAAISILIGAYRKEAS